MREIAKNIQDHWATIRPILSIRSEREYDRAVKRLNQLRIISEVLQGRRELSVQQVRALAHRFGVSPAVFI